MSESQIDRSQHSNPGSESTASGQLNAARQMDNQAWQSLLDRYSWLVLRWCHNAGLRGEAAADVLQMVMTQVAISLRSFEKDGKKAVFRRWLRTVTRTTVAQYYRAEGRQPHGEGGSAAHDTLLSVPADPESLDLSAPEVDPVRAGFWKLLDRLEESTWQAFWLTMVENQTSIEAGAILDMTPNAIRLAMWRVLRRLRAEAAALEDELRNTCG